MSNAWNCLVDDVRERIWDELCARVDMGYVDPDRGIIDTGMADDLDMNAIAASVIRLVGAELEIRHLLHDNWQQILLKEKTNEHFR